LDYIIREGKVFKVKKIAIALCAIVLILALISTGISCSSSTTTTTAATTTAATTTAPAVKTLKIGMLMGLTGPLAIPSLAHTRGWQLYADAVNEAGGVQIGNDKYLLDLVIEDSKGSAEGAGTATNKLVTQDKVKFVIGAMLESEVAAIYQVTEPAGVLYCLDNINIPGHAADVSADKDLMCRLAVSPDDNHLLDLDYLKKTYPNAKTIGIAAPGIGYAPMIEALKKQALTRGMSVVVAEEWQWGITDFVPTLTRVLAANPDIVWCMNSGNSMEALMAARQLGFKGPYVSNSPMGADVFVAVIKDPAMLTDCIINSPDVSHPDATVAALIKRWQAKWPNDPFNSDAVHAYDMPWILVQAMQKAGSIDPATVLKALETMTNPGDLKTNEGKGYMGGKDRFGVNRVLYRPFPITRLMGGIAEFVGFITPVTE
jgi:branched-chain amino acid transport system substrate-binding protein